MTRTCAIRCCTGDAVLNVNGEWYCEACAQASFGRSAPMPFADQIATLAPYIGRAADQIAPGGIEPEQIARLAVERFASIGAAEHGDALFYRTAAELTDEELAEYADAVIYRARRLQLAEVATP